MLRPALVVDFLILVLYPHRDIKVDHFRAKVLVNNKVMGLGVPVSDTENLLRPRLK